MVSGPQGNLLEEPHQYEMPQLENLRWSQQALRTDGASNAARSDGQSRLALTRRRDSQERRAIPEAVYPDCWRLELRGGISADRPGLTIPGFSLLVSEGLWRKGLWCRRVVTRRGRISKFVFCLFAQHLPIRSVLVDVSPRPNCSP